MYGQNEIASVPNAAAKIDDDHREWHLVLSSKNARGHCERRNGADRGEDEEVRPLQPPIHDPKVVNQRVDEHDDEEGKEPGREIGNQAVGRVPQAALALLDEPAGAEQRVADTQADAAKHSKRTEPAPHAANILAIRNRQALYKTPTIKPCMKAARRDPPAKLTSQMAGIRLALARNSKATPRKIKPANMRRRGR